MKKLLFILVVVGLFGMGVPAEARNAIGLGLGSGGLYPFGLLGLNGGYAIGAEANPGLSYIGLIGRVYEHTDFSGAYGSLVLGASQGRQATILGFNIIRLQGGYSFRLDRNGRAALALSYDSTANWATLSLVAELKYVF